MMQEASVLTLSWGTVITLGTVAVTLAFGYGTVVWQVKNLSTRLDRIEAELLARLLAESKVESRLAVVESRLESMESLLRQVWDYLRPKAGPGE